MWGERKRFLLLNTQPDDHKKRITLLDLMKTHKLANISKSNVVLSVLAHFSDGDGWESVFESPWFNKSVETQTFHHLVEEFHFHSGLLLFDEPGEGLD